MSTASHQFNSTIFRVSDRQYSAEYFCDEVYLYRKSCLKKIKEIVKLASLIPDELRETPKFKEIKQTLLNASVEGQLNINIDKGTVYCIPYQKIIDIYLSKLPIT